MSRVHAVILAGGSGTRFWPASRRARPKQLLALAGDAGEVLIGATVRRLAPLITPADVWLATGEALLDATAEALPGVPRAHLLAEPVPRNTAPAIGWAAATIAREDPDAIIVVLPADHFIADESGFRDVLERAVRTAEDGWITTVGIRPTRAETGYGYIELGDSIHRRDPANVGVPGTPTEGVHAVARFVEKPRRDVAESYVAGGRHLWNAGMFVFRAHVMLSAIAKHLPQLSDQLAVLNLAARTRREADELPHVFPKMPSISIDHGVMEKHDRTAVVPGDFGWNDVGSWEVSWELARHDAEGNAVPEGTVTVGAANNLVKDLSTGEKKRRFALLGVKDLVLVETDDAVLVMPRDRAQDVRLIVDALKERGETDLT
jgi:mannose-1-phosphate guanylyltransferase